MGAWLKLGVIVTVLVVSYVFTVMISFLVDFLASYLQLNAAPPTPYTTVAADLVAALTVTVVLVFFTVPAILAAFGHGGAWLKHVVSKVGKGLLAVFGISLVAYYAAVDASTIQLVPSFTSATGPVAILGLAGVLAVGLTSGGALLRLVEGIVTASYGLASKLPRIAGRHDNVAAIELRLTTTRQTRAKSEEKVIEEEALKFQRFARSLASLGCTTEFKLSFRDRRGRILILTKGKENPTTLEQRLLSVTKTYFPEARPAPAKITHEASPAVSILLTGAPEPAPNPLEPLARLFIENGFEGDYAVVLRGHRVNPASRLLARRAQRRLAKEAAEQRSTQSLVGDQISNTVQDQLVSIELEEAVKRVERQASSQAVEAWIYVTGLGRADGEALRVAESAAMVVKASLSSHRREGELKARRQRRPFQDLLPRGSPSVVLPSEAAPLVWIPQMAIGLEVAPATEFELPPPLEGEIELGEIVLPSGGSGHLAKLGLDDIPRHIYLGGMTGSGKTTTSFNVLLQLHNYGIPFLVIEPVKTEYRSLAACINGLQVFTPGEEEVAPFRLNIFEPPSGVSVKTHLDSLEASWNGSFVMYAPLPYVVKHVLIETYRVCGWDIGQNRRGRPVTLQDFRLSAEHVARKLGYEPNVIMNIEAALRTRITSLGLGGKGALFNTTASTPLETILRRPTVIELKGIPNSEEKAFVAALLLSNLAEYLEAKGQSKSLRHVTVVEEAHRLLPNVSTAKGDPEAADPRKTMVEQFANMLAEVRAYGEGLVIVEQIPTKILPDAIKNTATKVAHRVPAADDREVLAGAMGMTEEQSQVLTALKPGEAVVHLQRHPLPIRIVAPNKAEELGISVGEVHDDDVRRLMGEFYLKNPLPREPSALLIDRIQEAVDDEWFRAKFLEGYKEVLRAHNPDSLVELVTKAARNVSTDENEFADVTLRVLMMATEFYLPLDETDRERFPREVMAYIERGGRRARRG